MRSRARLAAPALVMALVSVPVCGAAQTPPRTPPIEPKLTPAPSPPELTVSPPPAADPAAPSRPLSAGEAVRIALRRQPLIAAAAGGVTTAAGNAASVRSALLPSLQVTGAYTHVDTLHQSTTAGSGGSGATGGANSGPTTISGFNAAASVKQLLFDFEHTRDLVRQADAAHVQAVALLTKQQQDTALAVKLGFYAWVQSIDLVGVDESALQARQAELDLAEARLRAGFGLPSDVVRAQTAVADAVSSLVQARGASLGARAAVAAAIGIDPRTPLTAQPGDEPAVPGDLTGLTAKALMHRPDLAAAAAASRAADFGTRAARTAAAPSIGLALSALSRGDEFVPGTDLFAAGLTVSWTPFDSGYTAGKIQQAAGQADAARAAVAGARLSVISDVTQAWIAAHTADQRLDAARAEVANAEESVRLAEGRYTAGLGAFLDVVDAQSALVGARSGLVAAQAGVNQARAQLAHATGEPGT